MKKIFLVGLIGILLPAQTHFDVLHGKILTFEKPWGLFLRKLYGCGSDPQVPITPETCKPETGEIDNAAFKLSREAAKKLFDLTER